MQRHEYVTAYELFMVALSGYVLLALFIQRVFKNPICLRCERESAPEPALTGRRRLWLAVSGRPTSSQFHEAPLLAPG